MIKTEQQELVRLAHALYNQTLYSKDEAHIFQAWWAQLQDLYPDHVRQKIIDISMQSKYMPTPGAVRLSIKKALIPDCPPGPHEFWAYLQEVRNNRNNGTHQITRKEVAEHPCVQKCIQQVGATVAFGLITNGDRAWVLEAYTEITGAFMALRLTVVESNA